MSDFEKWKDRYERHWCTKEQLRRLVNLNVLTEQEYLEITGEKFRE